MSELDAVLGLFQGMDKKIDHLIEAQSEMTKKLEKHIDNVGIHLDVDDRVLLNELKKKRKKRKIQREMDYANCSLNFDRVLRNSSFPEPKSDREVFCSNLGLYNYGI